MFFCKIKHGRFIFVNPTHSKFWGKNLVDPDFFGGGGNGSCDQFQVILEGIRINRIPFP